MLQYISKNLSHPLSLEEIGEAIFCQQIPYHLRIQKYTGFTFHQYVMKKKLIYAKHLLREYRSSSAVYSKSNFSSYPHFSESIQERVWHNA